jgi:hypothetical protein
MTGIIKPVLVVKGICMIGDKKDLKGKSIIDSTGD